MTHVCCFKLPSWWSFVLAATGDRQTHKSEILTDEWRVTHVRMQGWEGCHDTRGLPREAGQIQPLVAAVTILGGLTGFKPQPLHVAGPASHLQSREHDPPFSTGTPVCLSLTGGGALLWLGFPNHLPQAR